MRIGCLQFAPQVGDIDNNLNRADAVLSKANPEDLDILVLPELAFTGYNFKSLQDISPFLEPSKSGITSLWARTTALKYNCVVAAGYPEKVDVSNNWPTSPEYYNSLIVVNEEGETIANYRKTHLYYTDETWALENPKGFYQGWIPGIGPTAMGICMDLNPYRFETPWSAFEFAFHVLDVQANVVIMSMAWLSREDAREFSQMPKEPDMDTLTYWVKRLEPLIRSESEDEIIVIFANRTGVETEAVYAGTSAVIGIKNGEVSVYGLLGRGEKELLVVDTSTAPFGQLVYRPDQPTVVENDAGTPSGASPVQGATSMPPPKSTSSSTMSKSSNTAGAKETRVGSSEVPFGADGSDYGDHMTRDTATPLTRSPPITHRGESPISTRHFGSPLEHVKASRTPQSPISNTRFNHVDTPIEPNTYAGRSWKVEDASRSFRHNNTVSSRTPMISEEEDILPGGRPAQASPKSTSAGNVSSPKSRNHSRTRRRERSDSNVVARSAAHPKPQEVNPIREPRTPLDLEKLGADMLVFEEGIAPRRDSLLCHADEDDFVVLHSSRRGQSKPYNKEDDLQSKTHKHARNKSIDPEKRGVERSSPRRAPTPKLSSPRSGDYQSRSSKTSNRPKESPQLPDPRKISRGGEQRDSRLSPQKSSPRPAQRPFPRLTSPRSKGSQLSSNQTSPISQYDSPEPTTEEKVQSWNDQPSSRHGSHRGVEKNGSEPLANKKAVKPQVLPDESANDYTSSVVTIGIHNSPIILGDGLKTPKAMILVPEIDESEAILPTTKSARVETVPLKCVVSVDAPRHERPRSAVW